MQRSETIKLSEASCTGMISIFYKRKLNRAAAAVCRPSSVVAMLATVLMYYHNYCLLSW